MRIAKAVVGLVGFAGVVGVGGALAGAAPAFASPQPPAGGETQLLDSVTKTAQDLKNPLGEVDVEASRGELSADNPSAATAEVDNAVQGPVSSMIGGLPVGAGAPIG